jgi:hypothetical protein
MLEIVPDIAQSTHGIRNIADIRNVPTRPHMVLGMFLLAFSVLSIIQRIPGLRLFISQPEYSAALVETYPYSRKQNSPLPPDLNRRTLSEEDMAPLEDDEITLYRKIDHVYRLASTNTAQRCSSGRTQTDQLFSTS